MPPTSRTTERSYRGLAREIGIAAAQARRPDCGALRADAVSHWGVAQQLDHLLMTDSAVLDGLEALLDGSGAGSGGGRPTLTGRWVLWTGLIPRGKARAPEFVLPDDRSPEQIANGFEVLADRLDALGPALGTIDRSGATQAHPLLGHFTGAQWLRFAYLHHRHHRKIIADIERAAAVGPT